LARPFRFYVKKRGARRTDSALVGYVAQAMLFVGLLLTGALFGAYLLATLIIPEWRVNQYFRETKCVVLSKRLLELARHDGTVVYRPEFQFVYDVEGVRHQARAYDITRQVSESRDEPLRTLNLFNEGGSYPCWYSPDDPAVAVLTRGYTWWSWLLLLVPLAFVVVGGGGAAYALVNWGKSAERRAVMAQQIPGELFEPRESPDHDFPGVPRLATWMDSPGTRLAYRLAADVRPLWALGVMLGVALVVSAVALVLAMGLLGGGLTGLDWLSLLFVLLWFGGGIATAVFAVRRLWRASLAEPTILEISAHPLAPGQNYELFLSQPGRRALKRLALDLVCDERATFQHGTNTRRESRRVVESRIASQEGAELAQQTPFSSSFTLALPAHAMHSFRSAHNAIEWKILVRGESGSRTFERKFPVIVIPEGSSTG